MTGTGQVGICGRCGRELKLVLGYASIGAEHRSLVLPRHKDLNYLWCPFSSTTRHGGQV